MKKYIKETLKYVLRCGLVVRKYVKEVDSLYDMSPSELRQRNERKFLELFRKAYSLSPFYHRLYSEAGIEIDDIKSLEDITKLPIVTKQMVKEHGLELLTCNRRGLIANHTSGTTGTPLTVYENWEALWREQAYFVCYRKRCGFNYGEPLVSLRGTLGRSDTFLKVHVSNTLFLSSYNINEGTAELYHTKITEHNPKAIEGYPSSLYNLALVFRDKGLECDIPLAFTSSETLLEHQRALIEKVFHCQIFDHYGTTERTIRLEEDCNHDGYFESPGYGIEEYFDDYIISTSLINSAFPLIRYRTDDRIVLKDTTRKTKENFIDSIQGRSEDYLVCKDGTKIMRLGFVMKDIEGVDKSQLVQNEKGKVEVRLVAKKRLPDKTLQMVRGNMEERCGKGNMEITVRQVDESGIIYTDSHKFKYIHSNLIGGGKSLIFSGIMKIDGRYISYITGKDETQYSDSALTFIFKDANHVRMAQFVQKVQGGVVDLNIVVDPAYSPEDENRILELVQEKVGLDNIDLKINIIQESELIYSNRNKLALVVRI